MSDWIDLGANFGPSDQVWLADLVDAGWTIFRDPETNMIKICKMGDPGWMTPVEPEAAQ